ncbi:hypothetical protein V7089_03120, partial [Neobacillus drentensis]
MVIFTETSLLVNVLEEMFFYYKVTLVVQVVFGIRWTKRGQVPGKTSNGKGVMDETAQENRQNVYRKGYD